MGKLARARHVSRSTISRAVREDLGMKSFTRRRQNLLTEAARAIRRERAPKVLNLLKHGGSEVRVFVDEKKFVVEEVANRRNSRVIAFSPDEVAPVMKGKNPASVMVFGAVASDGRVMPPHFIPAGVRIGAEEYLVILKEALIPWMAKYYALDKVMLVQDSAPAHAAQRVQDFLSRRIPLFVTKEVWPSNSPDLNPCDFWMWGVLEEKLRGSFADQPAPSTRRRPGARALLSGAVSRVCGTLTAATSSEGGVNACCNTRTSFCLPAFSFSELMIL